MTAVEAGFVEHAANYGTRKGIAYATWREFGVAADVLNRAGTIRGQWEHPVSCLKASKPQCPHTRFDASRRCRPLCLRS